jgi:predicted ribosome quality control (RQC) complex YloA/Tae2 family protein
MKTENIFIQALDREILFYIGKNQNENFKVIDMGVEDDLWFHAKDESSCHVVCEIPDDIDIDKKELQSIIKTGALLCKNNTNKLTSLSNVAIIYTQIKNITKTKTPGCVLTQNTKTIIC